uniref:Annexin n=1 Tax=Artemia franciscana TaxID=6661 RepID=B2D0I4_ARTSF|nr:putative cuticle protein [Artemia franciscana]
MSYPPPYPGGYSQQGFGMPQPTLGFNVSDEATNAPSQYAPYPTQVPNSSRQEEFGSNPYPPTYPPAGVTSPYQPSANQGFQPYTSTYPASQVPPRYPASSVYPGYAPAQGPSPVLEPGVPSNPNPYPLYPSYPSLNQTQGYPVVQSQLPSRPQQQQQKMDGRPTVVPFQGFNATADAEALRKAMKGFGTDEAAIIQVLSRRTADQRMDILRAYKANFGKDLIKDLKSELSGNFERAILALMHPRAEYLAMEVREAIKGAGTQEGTLVEILAPGPNDEIAAICDTYYKLYGKSMEDSIASDTSGDFKRLLVALCQGQRDEYGVTDNEVVMNDAHRLYSAGEGKLGTEESAFIQVLATRSFQHLKQLQQEYVKITGRELEDAVASEFSGNIEKGLTAVLTCARSRPEYFAKRLNNAISGAGTHDRALIRCIVSRCEIDLATIKEYYIHMYGRALEEDIKNDTSGDYKKLLVALCGN